MAITGTWKNKQDIEAGAHKWGTGWNPVHAINDTTGRNIAPGDTSGGHIPEDWQTHLWQYDNDPVDIAWGTETEWENGTVDRPNWGEGIQQTRTDVTPNWPEWGKYAGGLPGGTSVRSHDHGANIGSDTNQTPTETVSEGWLNKTHGDVSDSRTSDDDQLWMQTSIKQRDAVRSGSQRGEGSASEFAAPVQQRIPGKKLKVYSGGRRHYDMFPRQQTERIRGWWGRNAGTGYTAWLQANSKQEQLPRTRTVPTTPQPGPAEGAITIDYGYQEEDMIPYA